MSIRSGWWVAFLLALGSLASAQDRSAPWRTSLQEALQEVSGEQKLLVFFHAPG